MDNWIYTHNHENCEKCIKLNKEAVRVAKEANSPVGGFTVGRHATQAQQPVTGY